MTPDSYVLKQVFLFYVIHLSIIVVTPFKQFILLIITLSIHVIYRQINSLTFTAFYSKHVSSCLMSFQATIETQTTLNTLFSYTLTN